MIKTSEIGKGTSSSLNLKLAEVDEELATTEGFSSIAHNTRDLF